jgi:geranylgeranyl reductase family protein
MVSGAAESYDLIIVGAGPAGSAAAVRAAQLSPGCTSRILLLDRACFPRVKICGGGIVRSGDYLLRRLGVRLPVHSTSVDATRFVFPSRTLTISRAGMFRVVRREELDHALLQTAESWGVQVLQGAPVLSLRREGDSILVSTGQGTFHARVVIGADGANGIVRKQLVDERPRLPMAGLETITVPTSPERSRRRSGTAVFDFRCTRDGIQGYSWDFPTGTAQAPLVNRGVIHTHLGGRSSRVSLKSYLIRSLRARGIEVEPEEIKGHPLHLYDPAQPCSAPRVLLAGDAIGVEPLLGEGISSALETGILAAEAASRAISLGDYSFSGYERALRTSHRMRSIRLKRAIAGRFYSGNPRWWMLLAAVALTGGYLRTAQQWDALRENRSVGPYLP